MESLRAIRELRGCWLANGDLVTISFVDGRIMAVGNDSIYTPSVDVGGRRVMPGIIDVHVHDRFPFKREFITSLSQIPASVLECVSETWEHFSAAALEGGVTSVCKMPNTDVSITSLEILAKSEDAIGEQPISHRVWFGATPENLHEIEKAAQHPTVCGVKMYMGSTTGNLLITDRRDQQRVLELCAELRLRCAIHAEDEQLMQANRGLLHGEPLMSDHCRIRDTAVETSAVRQALDLARVTGCDIHLCHISAPESVELARDAKDHGVRVTVGVCPHHIWLDEKNLRQENGGFYKMNPPLRTSQQMYLLRQYVRRPDYVDVLESDHAPHLAALKIREEYDRVPSGVSGVQTLLPLALKLLNNQRNSPSLVPLTRIQELLCEKPAEIAGLPTKGKIAVGYDADLVVLSDEEEVITNQSMKSKANWTPFAGMKAPASPVMVIVGGKVMIDKLST